jgi:hypothetical protein
LTGKAGFYRSAKIEQRLEARVRATTEQLFAVVNAHAPMWFAEELYNRIVDALRADGEKLPQAFFELFELLEQYAPRWYKKDLHDKAELLFRELKEKSTRQPGTNRTS